MSYPVLIIGESGSGKSASIRTLDPTSTYIINVLGKHLPFKGAKKNYLTQKGGNLFVSDNADTIVKLLHRISSERPEITTIIIDDFQYIMSNEYMRRIKDDRKGNKIYEKYEDIGLDVYNILNAIWKLREDIIVFVLSHSEYTEDNVYRFKTIGKLAERVVTVEGRFDTVLQAFSKDGKYYFKTNNDGNSTCKSPMDMFEDNLIDNDLQYVINKIQNY